MKLMLGMLFAGSLYPGMAFPQAKTTGNDDSIVALGLRRIVEERTVASDTILLAPYFGDPRGPAFHSPVPDAVSQHLRSVPRAQWDSARFKKCRLKTSPDCLRSNGRNVVATSTRPMVRENTATFYVMLEIAAAGLTERGRKKAIASSYLVTLERTSGNWSVASIRFVGGT